MMARHIKTSQSDDRSLPNLLIRAAVLVVLAAGSPEVQAGMTDAQRRETLQAAQQAFDRATQRVAAQPKQAAADYREAAEHFEMLVADGVRNGKLHYNLGNTYLQLGSIGQAILNYRRAQVLIDDDPLLRATLEYARSLRRNQIAPSGEKAALHTIFFWHYETPLRWRFRVAAGAYGVFWLALIVGAFTRAPVTRYLALITFVLWLAGGTSVAVELAERQNWREGVTLRDDIVVRKGNGEAYDPQFEESLHEGVEFIVLEQRPGWYKIELPDGSSGWVRQSQVGII